MNMTVKVVDHVVKDDDSSSTTDSLIQSAHSSSKDATHSLDKGVTSQGKSLKERSRIPASIYISTLSTLLLQYSAGLWRLETFTRWFDSIVTSLRTSSKFFADLRDSMQALSKGENDHPIELAKALIVTATALSLGYVFLWAPFRAGMWTGTRARKHKVHRYMGLAFLIQYALVWVEFGTNYENGTKNSVLPHFIAVNGIIQSISAFISFKVLPELEDAGYYSDKAVMSRNFVHENVFYSLMVVFGSLYYNDDCRASMRSSVIGKTLEFLFVFWPYVLLRFWFPTTRFKDAGTTYNGRTSRNESFYNVAVRMIKVFYLWAKYFLGFYINFLVYLDVVSIQTWKFLHGLYLLNEGTVSTAIFLHTLRFKKVLPPRLTMTIYIVQIYLTFTAIPLAYEMYSQHLRLAGVCLAGILCNLTRSRKVHAVWCVVTMILLADKDLKLLNLSIDW